MSMSHEEVIKRFKNGAIKEKGTNMFIEGNVLFDYGYHFPLLVRMPWGILQNGDKYSVTTSKHQSMCRHLATVIIPFSALGRAGMPFYMKYFRTGDIDMKLIDKADARTDETPYIDKDGIKQIRYERRPESAVIEHEGKYFLSSMDGQNYFLSELPRKVKTVADAFHSLQPKLAKGEEGKDYLRQGEWFFIPAIIKTGVKVTFVGKGSHFEKREYRWKEGEFYNERVIDKTLPQRNTANGTPHHYATEYGKAIGVRKPYTLVRGTVRHTQGDHGMLKLGNGKDWYIAVESNHVQSWGASGKID